MKTYKNNQLSDEILTITGEIPSWVVRAGAGIFSGIFGLILLGTWVIKYPEVLKGNAIVTTKIPPIRVVTHASGRMIRLLAKDEMWVRKGQVLAETENTTRLENIPTMQRLIGEAKGFLRNPQRQITFPNSDFVWGDLQEDFNLLRQSYLDLKRLQSDSHLNEQIERMQQQAQELRLMDGMNTKQQVINEEEFLNAEEQFRSDEKLYREGVYSKMEYLKTKNKYLEKQREREDFHKQVLSNGIKINEIERASEEFKYIHLEKKRQCFDNIERSVSNIENSLRNWRQNYLITAPADGKLVFLKNLAENQHLTASDTLFAVMPKQAQFIATVDIPVRGMGKAKVGQRVIIKLDDYPYQEFGMLEGVVENMAPSLSVRYYRVMVKLPNGLNSTYHQRFQCKSELAGSAEIVTADLRLIERAFYGIRKLLM